MKIGQRKEMKMKKWGMKDMDWTNYGLGRTVEAQSGNPNAGRVTVARRRA
jgi:hypothetical protein